MRNDQREFDPLRKLFIPADSTRDNLTWYGGMSWPEDISGSPAVVDPGQTICYRAYFRRGEATINQPHNTTPVLDEVVVGIAIPPVFLEYVVLQ